MYKKYHLDIAIISLPESYKNYKSIENQKKDEKDFKNEFKKINIEKIKSNWSENIFSTSFIFRKIMKIFSFSLASFTQALHFKKGYFKF